VDAVALQELDVRRVRSGGVDQAEVIAGRLEMKFHFQPVHCIEDEQYGNALLSRYPARLVKMAALPKRRNRADCEPRGALWIELDVRGTRLQVITTHLSIWPRERRIQAQALAGPEWLGHPDCRAPIILCGDFNALPGSAAYRVLAAKLRDAQLHLNEHRPHSTWFGRYPLSRIDHIFASSDVQIANIRVPMTELDKVASDHLPLIVEVRVPEAHPAEPAEPPVRSENRA
jgi:endonuclease/exonuclease/phosphatase family metal-dependent hydrolase